MAIYIDPMLKGITFALVIALAANGDGGRTVRTSRESENTIAACTR